MDLQMRSIGKESLEMTTLTLTTFRGQCNEPVRKGVRVDVTLEDESY